MFLLNGDVLRMPHRCRLRQQGAHSSNAFRGRVGRKITSKQYLGIDTMTNLLIQNTYSAPVADSKRDRLLIQMNSVRNSM